MFKIDTRTATVNALIDAFSDQKTAIETELSNRLPEIPKETCPVINGILREVQNLAPQARSLRNEDEFADQVDTLLCDLPENLEVLRSANGQLRTSFFDAVGSRKDALLLLEDLDLTEVCAALLAERDAARADLVALQKAIVGDTGLSAITVVTQTKEVVSHLKLQVYNLTAAVREFAIQQNWGQTPTEPFVWNGPYSPLLMARIALTEVETS